MTSLYPFRCPCRFCLLMSGYHRQQQQQRWHRLRRQQRQLLLALQGPVQSAQWQATSMRAIVTMLLLLLLLLLLLMARAALTLHQQHGSLKLLSWESSAGRVCTHLRRLEMPSGVLPSPALSSSSSSSIYHKLKLRVVMSRSPESCHSARSFLPNFNRLQNKNTVAAPFTDHLCARPARETRACGRSAAAAHGSTCTR